MACDDDDDDDLIPALLERQLFLARWPDGSATLLTASCLEEVADKLDELGDPGKCEVSVYDGPIAIDIKPRQSVDGDEYLDVALARFEDTLETQLEIMRVGFPKLHRVVRAHQDDLEEPHPVAAPRWDAALAEERERDLQPSGEWADGIASWWEATSGVSPDRTAALRQMMGVTVPGEPKPETPEQQRMFEAQQRRMMESVAAKLVPAVSRPAKPRKPARSKKQPPKKTR